MVDKKTVLMVFGLLLIVIVSVIVVIYGKDGSEEVSIVAPEKSMDVTFNLPDIDEPFQPCYSIENTGKLSCIPNVICPGFMKSGTTFLYYTLIHHPKIARATVKEVNFFLNQPQTGFQTGLRQYSSHFVHNATQIIIDVSPKYFMRVESAEYIYQTNKNAKFIVILRDPVDRAYSHFWFEKHLEEKRIDEIKKSTCPNRIEELNFKQYINEEYQLLKECDMIPWKPKKPSWDDMIPKECGPWSCIDYDRGFKHSCSKCFPLKDEGVHVTNDVGTGYLMHSIYVTIIEHYLQYFPLENFLFIRFEDLLEKGDVYVLNEIARWLEIEELSEEEWGDLSNTNSNDYPPIDEDEEKYLTQFFREPNERLYKLLGRDFGWRR